VSLILKKLISFGLIFFFLAGALIIGYSFLLNHNHNPIKENSDLPKSALLENWNSTWDQFNVEYGQGMTIDENTDELYTVGYNGTPNNDIIIIKYSNSGNQIWNITWDGGANEFGYDIALDSQKNIYIAGGNGTTFPNYDSLLLKFDSTGTLVWNRTYDGGSYDSSWALYIDSNDQIFLISESILASYDTVLFKYNTSGDLQWSSVISGVGYQTCRDIALDSNGNIYLAGLNGSSPSYNYLVVKLDNAGNHVWNRTWGGVGNDQGFAVGVDSFDNVYITGFSNSYGSTTKDITLIKYDTNGNKLWNRTWGSIFSDEGRSIGFDSTGYVYVGGYELFANISILKYNSEGTLVWNKTWNKSSSHEHWCHDLIIDSNDKIYFTGHTRLGSFYDIITVKLSIESPGGFYLWSNADFPDDNGNFTLFWSVSPRVNNYSLYYSDTGADIDVESDIPLVQTIWNNQIDVSLEDGTYYFLVVARNNFGYSVSNYTSVTVQIETNGNGQPAPRIPGCNIIVYSLFITGILYIILIRTKKSLK
jgi:uncharacterized delta-60 repeat protein